MDKLSLKWKIIPLNGLKIKHIKLKIIQLTKLDLSTKSSSLSDHFEFDIPIVKYDDILEETISEQVNGMFWKLQSKDFYIPKINDIKDFEVSGNWGSNVSKPDVFIRHQLKVSIVFINGESKDFSCPIGISNFGYKDIHDLFKSNPDRLVSILPNEVQEVWKSEIDKLNATDLNTTNVDNFEFVEIPENHISNTNEVAPVPYSILFNNTSTTHLFNAYPIDHIFRVNWLEFDLPVYNHSSTVDLLSQDTEKYLMMINSFNPDSFSIVEPLIPLISYPMNNVTISDNILDVAVFREEITQKNHNIGEYLMEISEAFEQDLLAPAIPPILRKQSQIYSDQKLVKIPQRSSSFNCIELCF